MDAGRIDLERARREAKRRVKDARARGEALKLADAQLAIARELGEASWPRLVHRAEAESVAREDRARRLVQEATDGRRDHAEALLALDPDLGREGLDAALVLGEAERVRAALARDPARGDPARGRARVAPAALRDALRLPRRRAHRRAARLRAGAARRRRRPRLELAAPGVRRARRALRRGGRRPRAAHDRAAARGGREPRRRRVRLPRDRDLRSHLPAPAARRGRARGGHERAGARARHRGPREGPAAARARRGQRGRALAAVGDLPRALAGGHPPARRARRRRARLGRDRTSARPTASPGAWAAPTSASCSPSWARGARSGRSTS